MNTLDTPYGGFTLNRYPVRENETLRAWDAADEYILQHLAEQAPTLDNANILIVNDTFGALAISLNQYQPTSISDSYISQQACIENVGLNNIKPQDISLNNTLAPLQGVFSLVIIKIPKNLAMLEDELYKIRPHCNENTIILAAAMSKHIHTSTLKLFERIIGTTTTSLAQKKARLVFSQALSQADIGVSPYPKHYKSDITNENYSNHANVFSREKLDLGSRFMLEHIPQSENYSHILDLACGNGVLGIAAAKLNPSAKVCFVDESFMAVESAKINVKNLLNNQSNYDFKVTDCLQGLDNDAFDLIINNPPFHQNHVVGDFIAWQMFNEAKQKLKTGGELIIVGNRHLGYHIKLKKLFGRCEMLASNEKFVVLKSIK